MTGFIDNPTHFREDWTEGFVRSYSRYVEHVEEASGVIRTGGARVGKVALVIGGGSGHYPAFAGLVGSGLADAAVIGDVFTSPSSEQVQRVIRAAHGGAGVLLSFGNYAGDVLNFGLAQERLRAEGIECRTVLVTDDVASASQEERSRRRGVAGTFVVFKIAGAAAAEGADLDEIERIARRANERTRTLGVAFSSCHLPGSREPLFAVSANSFEIGLGIHGEPGINTVDAVGPKELAALLLAPLLRERMSDGGTRAAVLLNGLGSTKYEELFVLWKHVDRRLVDEGIDVVLPEVGEFVTSLDTGGCSLTLCWLDDDLERLWRAPVDSPSFRRGNDIVGERFDTRPQDPVDQSMEERRSPTIVRGADAEPASDLVRAALTAILAAVQQSEVQLGRLDAVAGDGDHGTGMTRGLKAASEAANNCAGGVGAVLQAAGTAFGDRAGGTSGVLWGLLLVVGGQRLTSNYVRARDVGAAVKAAADALMRLGGAVPGDKTMLDALVPFSDTLTNRIDAGDSLSDAWSSASRAARTGATASAMLSPRVGRARPLATRSVGFPDPGAVSFALAVSVAGEVVGHDAEELHQWQSALPFGSELTDDQTHE